MLYSLFLCTKSFHRAIDIHLMRILHSPCNLISIHLSTYSIHHVIDAFIAHIPFIMPLSIHLFYIFHLSCHIDFIHCTYFIHHVITTFTAYSPPIMILAFIALIVFTLYPLHIFHASCYYWIYCTHILNYSIHHVTGGFIVHIPFVMPLIYLFHIFHLSFL